MTCIGGGIQPAIQATRDPPREASSHARAGTQIAQSERPSGYLSFETIAAPNGGDMRVTARPSGYSL
jgi:hypothetical protein